MFNKSKYIKKLIIEGMHCDACAKIVQMELDDIGVGGYVAKIDVLKGENKGTIYLDESITGHDLGKVRQTVGSIDGYKVV